MEYLLPLSLIFIAISGASEAVMDKIQFHFEKSIFSKSKYNSLFWNPSISWKNKYESIETLKPKFWGSTTYFVFLTDAWHLFKFFKNTFIFVAISLAFLISCNSINYAILYFIIGRSIYGASFSLMFYKILKL